MKNLKNETNKQNDNKTEIPYCKNCKYSAIADFGDGTYDMQCWKNRPFYEVVDDYDGCKDYRRDTNGNIK